MLFKRDIVAGYVVISEKMDRAFRKYKDHKLILGDRNDAFVFNNKGAAINTMNQCNGYYQFADFDVYEVIR